MLWDNTHYYFYYDYHSYQYNIFDTGNTQKGQQSIVFLLIYYNFFSRLRWFNARKSESDVYQYKYQQYSARFIELSKQFL